MTPRSYLEKLFTEPHADAAWFHPSFSSKVPVSKVDEITKQITSSAGKLQSIRETGEHKYEVAFEKISIDATIILQDGKIQTLFVRPGASNAASLEAISASRMRDRVWKSSRPSDPPLALSGNATFSNTVMCGQIA